MGWTIQVCRCPVKLASVCMIVLATALETQSLKILQSPVVVGEELKDLVPGVLGGNTDRSLGPPALAPASDGAAGKAQPGRCRADCGAGPARLHRGDSKSMLGFLRPVWLSER